MTIDVSDCRRMRILSKITVQHLIVWFRDATSIFFVWFRLSSFIKYVSNQSREIIFIRNDHTSRVPRTTAEVEMEANTEVLKNCSSTYDHLRLAPKTSQSLETSTLQQRKYKDYIQDGDDLRRHSDAPSTRNLIFA